jgi:hypothetical protein
MNLCDYARMTTRPNDKAIREVAGRVIGISPKVIFASWQDGELLLNFQATMLLEKDDRQRMQREIAAELGGGFKVSFT